MPIADDWDFDYPNTVLQHVDGVLSYDVGSGTQPAVGDYVYGVDSGAIGKVIARTGTVTSGTLDLTNTVGLFEDNEQLDICSTLGFDAVTDGNGGFQVGDRIDGNSSGSQVTVLAIEYNEDGLGGGTIYGNVFTAVFTNNEQLDIGAPAARVQLDVADADGVGVDNDAALTASVMGTLARPGTNNDSAIIHYDAGSVAIPEQGIIEGATSGATALVEQVYGVLGTGSVRLVDINGTFQDNETLRMDQALLYQNQVAGQVFSVGDVVVGATSNATGRVIVDTGTTLVFADESGTWTTTEDLEVGGVKIAEANGTNTTLNVATSNIPAALGGIRDEQWSAGVGGGVDQGGIYAAGSLNVMRKLNSLYTLSQDTFDELLQLDDDEAMDASVKGGAYSLVFGWFMPELSTRFLRQGGLVDTTSANIWANPQTVGVQNKITDTAFFYDSSQPYRQPQLYIEQDQRKIPIHWLEGQIDVLVKVKTRNDPRYIAPATPTLGQLIPGGDPQVNGAYTVLNREYHVSTYDATQFNAAAGGVNTVALGTGDETVNNPTATHSFSWNAGGAETLVVGETFTSGSGNALKVGIVVAQTGDGGATGTVDYVLKSGTQFVNTDVCEGSVSSKAFTANSAITNEIASQVANVAFSVVDIAADSTSSTISGTFIPGEPVSQATTGATGRVVLANTTTDILYIDVDVGSAAFSGLNVITGGTSAATWTPTGTPTYATATSFNADLNNGEGAQPYAGSASGDITGGSAQTIQTLFEYGKYLSRHEEDTYVWDGPGTGDDGNVGRFYRKLKAAYAEVKPGAPHGTYTGSLALAQGWFLDTGYIAAADIRSFSVIDDNGVTRNPPNLQSLTISGVAAGWRCAAYRSTGAGQTAILRTEFDVGTVGGGNNQDTDSTVLVGANSRTVSPLPADVPDTGVLRILSPNDTGNYIRMDYSSVDRTNNIFTLTGTIASFLTAAGETSTTDLTLNDNVHVCFIEEQAAGTTVTNTIQYVADIEIVFKARLKGFKPFRSTGTFTSSGANLGVVQTPDSIVDLP
jgi:hypothetical protein